MRRLQRSSERRGTARIELLLEPSCRSSDLVEPRGGGELGEIAHDVSKRVCRRFRVLDSLWRLARTKVGEARDEPVEVTASCRIDRNLAERGDRDRCAKLGATRDDGTLLVDADPRAGAVRSVDGTDIDTPALLRLRRQHPGHDVAGARVCRRERRRALEIVAQRHVATIGPMPSVDAKELFAPLGPTYDRVGAALSFGQDPLWRRFLVSRLPRDESHVIDVATGTGLVAAELVRRGFRVTGVDQSEAMLARARHRFADRVELVGASAENLPFADASFDHMTFTYLLRYVADPGATLAELARVVRPGGVVASLEFGVPAGIARPPWELYVRAGLPLAGRLLRHGWHEVGDFLGSSIREYWERYPIRRQLELWDAAGIHDVEVRRLSLGGGVVMWGRRA